MTVSGVPPPAEAVVKVQVWSDANALPAASFTPVEPPWIVAVYVVPAARSAPGFNVATLFVCVTAAGTVVDPAVNVNVPEVTVDASVARERPRHIRRHRHTGGASRRRRSRHGRGRRIPPPPPGPGP